VTGSFPPFDTDFPWIGNLDRSEQSIREAVDVLNNPSLKLEHSLFWFWSCSNVDMLAMEALKEGDIDRASSIWSKDIEKYGLSEQTIIQTKNLAVLSYIRSFQGHDFNLPQFVDSIEGWGKTLSLKRLIDKIELFHPDLKDKADDEGLANIIGNVLHRGFLSQWIEDNNWEKVAACFTAFSKAGFPQAFQDRIIKVHITPVMKKIEKLCSELSGRQFSNMTDLLESVEDFRGRVLPELKRLNWVLPGSDPRIEHYSDKVGQIIRKKAIDYGISSKDWIKTKELCEFAKSVAMGPVLRETLDKDLATISKNINDQELFGKLQPIENAPGLGTWNTIGTMLYGISNLDPETKSYETTLYFVVLFIPLFPLSRYRVIGDGNRYSFLGKLPFRSTEKWHLGLFLCSIVFLLALLGFSGGSTNTYDDHSVTTPHTSATDSVSYLNSDIEDSKRLLNLYESELKSIDSLHNPDAQQMKSLYDKIKEAESKFANGFYVDTSAYESNIETYNNLVKEDSSRRDDYNKLYKKYEDLWNETNNQIDRYNRLIGKE
jgi:hypothetical protein